MSQCHDTYDYEPDGYPAPEEATTAATPSCHDGYDQPVPPESLQPADRLDARAA